MRRLTLPLALLLALLTTWGPTRAQVRPLYSLGTAGLVQTLQRLQTTASVLHTGAHPDDEDSFFIARVARGDHARVGYLALNRGEGGQNIIGPELFEALGVIRTEELLQARRLDGGEQYFTRTFDYGFSKTLEEASAKWDEQAVLGDMVRIIRLFRPLVIYSRFSGTTADGHGHHSMAGHLTPLAFKAAADPAQFPEHLAEGLRPWQARKLYRGQRFPPDASDPPSVTVETGRFDPLLGRSYAEIASEGRSQHKSQSMGSIEVRGPLSSGLKLLTSLVQSPAREASVFDGIDTSIAGIAGLSGLPAGALKAELDAVSTAAAAALADFNALKPRSSIPALATGLKATRAARQALTTVQAPASAKADADFLLAQKEQEFTEALARAAEVVVDPLIERETVVPGGTVSVSVRTFAPDAVVKVVSATVIAPAGWVVTPAEGAPADPTGNPFARREAPLNGARFTVTVPTGTAPTQPYFLTTPRKGESYAWTDPLRGLPFAPPSVQAAVTLDIGGERIVVREPAQFRMADPVRGELRRNLAVTPAVAVRLDSDLLIVPTSGPVKDFTVVVQATSFAPDAVTGTLRLRMPPGWTSTPAEAPFTLTRAGDETSTPFTVRPPAARKAGSLDLVAEATVGSAVYNESVQTIAYPHIQTHRLYRRAKATAQVFDLKVAPVKVGYIMGTGDEVPDALRRMGVNVTLLGHDALATGNLAVYDTIVVGIRASQARPDFVANHGRLVQYVEKGGTLVVQYQQNDYATRKLPPFPVTIGARVTDEQAPVTILTPAHAAFTFPNAITPDDFGGWVQDRDLYAFTTFDPKYTPMLSTFDRGEKPQNGGQVYVELGKGRYVYTSYAWFRQLPAGVPGAYRLFANLVSLPKATTPATAKPAPKTAAAPGAKP